MENIMIHRQIYKSRIPSVENRILIIIANYYNTNNKLIQLDYALN